MFVYKQHKTNSSYAHLCAICNWTAHRCSPQRTASAKERKLNKRCPKWRQHKQKQHKSPAKRKNIHLSKCNAFVPWDCTADEITRGGVLTSPWQWKVVYTLPKKSQHGHRYSSLNSRMKSASSTRVHIIINFRKVYALQAGTRNDKKVPNCGFHMLMAAWCCAHFAQI